MRHRGASFHARGRASSRCERGAVAAVAPVRQSDAVNQREHLIAELLDARARSLDLFDGLPVETSRVPRIPIVNPPLWEIGHVAWFQERWTRRNLRAKAALRDDADALWDSAAIEHDRRWEIPLPSRDETLAYAREVLERVIEELETADAGAREDYFHRLVTYHEDMHGEAFVYTRQTLALAAPRCRGSATADIHDHGGPHPGDARIPGGTFELGARRDLPFVFDNEKWAHTVELAPFRIALAPVTQSEFLEFVNARGYERSAYWSDDGWRWRNAVEAQHPVYWTRAEDGRWMRRAYDELVPLEPHKPVLHVSWYEAEAFCNFAERRLPTEAEWELAAGGGRGPRASLYPWGDDPPDRARAELDLSADGCCDVGAHPGGDSAFGCRQMIGNVWEWTASDFVPYPAFTADPYREYSEPWFGTHKVLRGGCFATRARLLRNTWRNFYTPDRRDVLAGFRTCAR
jgi:iron(II)-dependent oxidoreductase